MSIHQRLAEAVNDEPEKVTPHDADPRNLVFGPYLLMPRHRVLAESAEPKSRRSFKYGRVALYDDIPALLATEGMRLVAVPISQFDPSGRPTPPAQIEQKIGPATFLLPAQLFRDLPKELSSGQSHVELTVEYSFPEKAWFAYVKQQPMPSLGKQHRYRLEDGYLPDPEKSRWPSPAALERVLAQSMEEASKVITFDTSFLRSLTRAIGTRDVEMYLHGRTGVIRVEPTGFVDDDYGIHAIGLLMPITDHDDHLADEIEQRRCNGGAC